MSEMVERVAAAIHFSIGTINGDEALAAAVAAMEAMRRPTKQMATSAAAHAADFVGYAGDNGEDLAIEMWSAMIEAALREPTK